MTIVRPPAVAGAFYSADPDRLRAELGELLFAEPEGGPAPKALIVPHAGYVYSGPVAARAYARLKASAGSIRRVLLLGPAHRVPVSGVAIPGSDIFRTPLGDVPLDRVSLDEMSGMRGVHIDDKAHALEHSLEVQLPFLQMLLHDFLLLPLLVGNADPEDVAALLEAYKGGPETLILVSSDLSHFMSHAEAAVFDAETSRSIETLETEGWAWESACGRIPILGLLLLARHLNLEVETLDLRNSGDTAGDRDRVVGYGAWSFHERKKT